MITVHVGARVVDTRGRVGYVLGIEPDGRAYVAYERGYGDDAVAVADQTSLEPVDSFDEVKARCDERAMRR